MTDIINSDPQVEPDKELRPSGNVLEVNVIDCLGYVDD